jgi:hypothetical protein
MIYPYSIAEQKWVPACSNPQCKQSIQREIRRDLWTTEKTLLQLLHVDSTGSKTWFLDSCGTTTNPAQRLLLSNYDIGRPVPAKELQLGLNFAKAAPELFAGKEMGEDAIRVLNGYIRMYSTVRAEIACEIPHLRQTIKWASKLAGDLEP